jgi:uncharacterized SAM-binding protein YcdF (DUF218 family)
LVIGFLLILAIFLGLEWHIYDAIRRQAGRDEAARAGAIVVFGAAQYDGEPSPVFEARLDHAFDLEEEGFAPVVITTGAGGGDRRYTEAGTGRDYLIQQGVSAAKIVTDPFSRTTYESVQAVARILAERHARTCIAVSDGFHLYRVELMLRAAGITAYASPAPDSPIEADAWSRTLHSLYEVASTTAWYVGYRR